MLLWAAEIRTSTKAEAERPQITSRPPDATLTINNSFPARPNTRLTDAYLEQSAGDLQVVENTTKMKS
jgi:hypothetical protein